MEMNGLVFNATEESVVEPMLALAAGRLKESGYAVRLEAPARKT